MGLFPSILSVVLAASLSFLLTWLLQPLMRRYALARPNARSSHTVPTPQGGGIAVIIATLVVSAAMIRQTFPSGHIPSLVFGATLFIAALGCADDIKSIPVAPRLFAQALAISAILLTWPAEFRIMPACPFWVERVLVLLSGLWFVNLVNFMDGLDWMTVAEVIPVTGALVVYGLIGDLTPTTALVAAALAGGVIGFAPFNRPVAKVFLGDVGSLPIGLLLGWCLLELGYRGEFTAALLLPLYYFADATITMLRRLATGEKIWIAHRSHFYQRATSNGFSVPRVVGTVFVLNLLLAGLAIASMMTPSLEIKVLYIIGGAAAVATVIFFFSRRR